MTKLIDDDIKGILEDLEIETLLKTKIDEILFSELPIKKKRIAIRKLKRQKLEPKFIKMFLKLLEYIDTVQYNKINALMRKVVVIILYFRE